MFTKKHMTLFIVLLTSMVSILAWQRPELLRKLQLNPYSTIHRNEWWRLITHAFVHADWIHLIINMLVLFSFGQNIEALFNQLQAAGIIANAKLSFTALYFGGIIFSSVTTMAKQKDNFYYNSVGASGAVSAIVFTSIFFAPWQKVYFYGILGIPGIVLGVAYLIYSYMMSKKGKGNINHDAHFMGAVFGFVFPVLVDYHLVEVFLSELVNFNSY